MSRTKIEWCAIPGTRPEVWNPVVGCTKVSPGCNNCYAEAMARRLAKIPATAADYAPTIRNGRWSGRVMTLPHRLMEPFHWRLPRTVFVNSMSDLFHPKIPIEFITQVFDVMCTWRWPSKAAMSRGNVEDLEDPGHTYIVLTKRPELIPPWLAWVDRSWPADSPLQLARRRYGAPPNILLGASVENQETLDRRLPHLKQLAVQGWRTILSAEPFLGPIQLPDDIAWLSWLIIGGESGSKARRCFLEWIRSLLRQGSTAAVPSFVKQIGRLPVDYENGVLVRPDQHLKHPKGNDLQKWPQEFQLREWPIPFLS